MHWHTPQTRRGFTLLELLVVIGIILLLISISVMVMGNVLRSAREQATRATIQKVDGMLRQRQEAFQRALERAELQGAVAFTKGFCRQAFPSSPVPIDRDLVDRASDRTWEVLARKTYFRAKFPQSFAEVAWFDGAPGIPGSNDTTFGSNTITDVYTSTFPHYSGVPDPQELGAGTGNDDLEPYARLLRERFTDPTLHNPETESSEMLYLILTGADLFGVPPAGQDEFSSSEVRDTDNDGLQEFIDGWGRPLRFYRWPTRLLRCGEDTFTGDTDGDTNLTEPAGAAVAADPRYANLLIGSLPALTPQYELQSGDKQLLRDPDDGFGLLEKDIINRNDGGSATGMADARQKLELLYHTPSTYHTVLVVSAGADGILGLYEPVQFELAANVFGHLAQPTALGDPSASPLADNITNRRQK
ncbi:MAG: prepilin-type N-terminal cleavage/methylation domain-containing protein [Planctomycetaceae bacterium]|nr:prepilin-type N-terminal cleavage/methylation domain-containing protein [Planctomycetaceae bacterium]